MGFAGKDAVVALLGDFQRPHQGGGHGAAVPVDVVHHRLAAAGPVVQFLPGGQALFGHGGGHIPVGHHQFLAGVLPAPGADALFHPGQGIRPEPPFPHLAKGEAAGCQHNAVQQVQVAVGQSRKHMALFQVHPLPSGVGGFFIGQPGDAAVLHTQAAEGFLRCAEGVDLSVCIQRFHTVTTLPTAMRI